MSSRRTERLFVAALLSGTLGGAPATSSAFDARFDASFREQIETVSDDTLGAGGEDDTIAQHRLLVSVDLAAALGLRAFAQLGAYAQNGRNGGSSPVDESDPDLQQGYLEWHPGQGPVTLIAGRREWTLGSGRLVSVRDGPNIRRAFDGAEIAAHFGHTAIRVLAGRPVRNEDGAFDDERDRGEHLAGLQVAWPIVAGLTAELYGLDYAREDAAFASRVGDEDRRSFGLRLAGDVGPLRVNTEIVWQNGTWRGERIRAWTVANDFGWALKSVPLAPTLGLKVDLASGDADPGEGRLHTFNALYPNPSYFSEASLIAPANLIDVQPHVRIAPSKDLELRLGWDVLWKHRTDDAVYSTPVPLTPVDGSAGTGRFVGHQVQMSVAWTAIPHLRVEASAVHFEPHRALSGLQNDAIDFVQLVLTVSP